MKSRCHVGDGETGFIHRQSGLDTIDHGVRVGRGMVHGFVWNSSCAEMPAPQVGLSMRRGTEHLASSHLRQPSGLESEDSMCGTACTSKRALVWRWTSIRRIDGSPPFDAGRRWLAVPHAVMPYTVRWQLRLPVLHGVQSCHTVARSRRAPRDNGGSVIPTCLCCRVVWRKKCCRLDGRGSAEPKWR